MANVKWIKITTDIFDDEKILLIESLPDAYAIIVVWFKLLCLAGKQNNSGVFMMNDKIAYTDKMLATILRMKESTVTMALKTFEEFGMIEIVDGVITIPNWGKHQNLDQLEERKQYMKNYMQEYRQKQKQISCKVNSKANSKVNVNSLEEDKEKERDKEEERERERETIDYSKIVNMYNDTCMSFPKITKLSDSRKKSIKARLNTYNYDDFQTLFNKAEASDFLKGKNNRDWQANFDWLIKDSNMAKTLDGNYDNKSSQNNQASSNIGSTTKKQLDAYMKKLEEEQNEPVVDDESFYEGLL